MPEPTAREIDRRVCWAVNGELRGRIPAYSSSDRLTGRLIAWLARSGIDAFVESAAGAWYCALRRGAERIASGIGGTRASAVARAIANCDFASPPEAAPRPRRSAGVPRPSGPGQPRRCGVCDVPLGPSKGLVRLPRLCNVCSWGRLKEKPPRK